MRVLSIFALPSLRHFHSTRGHFFAILLVGFMFGARVEPVEAAVTEVHHSIMLGVLFVEELGKILNPHVVIRDRIHIVIQIFFCLSRFVHIRSLRLYDERADVVFLFSLREATGNHAELAVFQLQHIHVERNRIILLFKFIYLFRLHWEL